MGQETGVDCGRARWVLPGRDPQRMEPEKPKTLSLEKSWGRGHFVGLGAGKALRIGGAGCVRGGILVAGTGMYFERRIIV